jgi:hypothetical protein
VLVLLTLQPRRQQPRRCGAQPPRASVTAAAATRGGGHGSGNQGGVAVGLVVLRQWQQRPQEVVTMAAMIKAARRLASSCIDDDGRPRRWWLGLLTYFARSRGFLELRRGNTHIDLDEEAALDLHTSTVAAALDLHTSMQLWRSTSWRWWPPRAPAAGDGGLGLCMGEQHWEDYLGSGLGRRLRYGPLPFFNKTFIYGVLVGVGKTQNFQHTSVSKKWWVGKAFTDATYIDRLQRVVTDPLEVSKSDFSIQRKVAKNQMWCICCLY